MFFYRIKKYLIIAGILAAVGFGLFKYYEYTQNQIRIYAENATSKDAAIDKVNSIIAEAEVGRIYQGTVARIVDFGAFVNILPGKDGLLHISQIAQERVEKVSDYLSEGEEIDVIVLDVDQRGRIKLSIKEIPESAGEEEQSNNNDD